MSKTVKVRIPVAVDRHGDVAVPECFGWHDDAEKVRRLGMLIHMRGIAIVWREFEVPIPEPVEVEGRVGEWQVHRRECE